MLREASGNVHSDFLPRISHGFVFSVKLTVLVMKIGWFYQPLVHPWSTASICNSAKAEGAKAFALSVAIFRSGYWIMPSSPGPTYCHGAWAWPFWRKLLRAINKHFQAHICSLHKDLQCQRLLPMAASLHWPSPKSCHSAEHRQAYAGIPVTLGVNANLIFRYRDPSLRKPQNWHS